VSAVAEVFLVALIGLATTSSAIAGAAIGLYFPLSRRLLACVLAFSAGALISALAIELAYEGAVDLRQEGFSTNFAWVFIGGGFAVGACFYYAASLFLEKKGGAVRYRTRFREYARGRKQRESRDLIGLLARCDLLRHLPPDDIEQILPCIRDRHLAPGEILFRSGDPGDALYIVARGKVRVLAEPASGVATPPRSLAELSEGNAFGEMALLSGGTRTATVQAIDDTDLLAIERQDFDQLIADDRQLAAAVERLSHQRAISNLSVGGTNPSTWARLASSNLDHLSRSEESRILAETGGGSGLAIVLGNILDTIPGCLVIGAKFIGFQSLSLTLILGMFLGGIPEAAASAAMLRKAGYRPDTIFLLWSTVLVAGVAAAAAGKLFIGSPDSMVAIFCQALAGGAVLALVAHAMLPEALDEGGSLVVLPTVAGFLFALYLALKESIA